LVCDEPCLNPEIIFPQQLRMRHHAAADSPPQDMIYLAYTEILNQVMTI
jgi:hypothetical protein